MYLSYNNTSSLTLPLHTEGKGKKNNHAIVVEKSINYYSNRDKLIIHRKRHRLLRKSVIKGGLELQQVKLQQIQ